MLSAQTRGFEIRCHKIAKAFSEITLQIWQIAICLGGMWEKQKNKLFESFQLKHGAQWGQKTERYIENFHVSTQILMQIGFLINCSGGYTWFHNLMLVVTSGTHWCIILGHRQISNPIVSKNDFKLWRKFFSVQIAHTHSVTLDV